MTRVKEWMRDWFGFTTRELVIMALLIAFTSVFSSIWVQVTGSGILGPLRPWVASYGFNLCAVLVLYFVPKPGAVVLVKFIGGLLEILLGNPFGPFATYYGTVEGLGFAIAFVVMRQTLSLPMIFVGAVLAWLFAAPVDVWIDKVPLNAGALFAYFGPGFLGRISSSVLVYLTVLAVRRAGLKPSARLLPDPQVTTLQRPKAL